MKEKRCFHVTSVHFVHTLWADVMCSGATVKETEEDQDENDIE